jgi:hypothetical protein
MAPSRRQSLGDPPDNYEEVMESITSLQADLESKHRTTCTLKEENTLLQKSYDNVKASLKSTQDRYESLRVTLKQTGAAAATKREQSLEEALVACRSQTDKYRSEIESIRKELHGALKDDVVLRAQVQVQIEASAQAQIQKLENEGEQCRKTSFEAKKELENVKATLQLTQKNEMGTLEHLKELHAEEMKALNNTLHNLLAGKTCCDKSCNDSPEIASLKQHVFEVEAERDSLRNEMVQMESQLDSCNRKSIEHTAESEMKMNVRI